MITKAKFKGQNGSLNYIKNKIYWFIIETKNSVKIAPIGDGGKPCEYANMRLFLNNWEILE